MDEKYLPRELLGELGKYMPRKEIIAVKGPRQSGKTTLLRMLSEWLVKKGQGRKEAIHTLTFEDMDVLEKFSAAPKEFITSLLREEERNYLFLDEFHYAKEGGKKLKLLYDTMKNVKFVVTGSSSLEITEFSKNLVGRVFSFDLLPFSFWEFLNARDPRLLRAYEKRSSSVTAFLSQGKGFPQEEDIFLRDILKHHEEYALYGGYPEVVKSKDPETRVTILKNIYETYITKDIVGLLRMPDALKFRKLVSLLASQASGIINYNELSSSIGSYYKDTLSMLSSLEETYVVSLLRPFHRNLKTELKKNPKAFFLDTGLRNFAVSDFNPLETRPDRGMLMENVVFNSLSRRLVLGKLNYWRTLSKAEVDFVVTMGSEAIPVEVKYSRFRQPKISRSFRSFLQAYNPSRALVATRDFWGEMLLGKTMIKFVPACYL